MTELPPPLTPADCDLRGLPFMPLRIMQVMQSETFGLSTGDEFKAAFALWCSSWMEVPAASLPSDDRMLEFLSRSKVWRKVKPVAMRGWVLCADGRLYHPVVAVNALEAWDKRTDYREKEGNKTTRQQRWREQCQDLSDQLRALGVTPPRGASLTKLRDLIASHCVDAADTHTSTQKFSASTQVDAVEIGKTETVKRQGQLTTKAGSGSSTVNELVPAPRVAPPLPMREDSPLANDPAVRMSVFLRRLGIDVLFTHPAIKGWVQAGVPEEVLSAAVAKAKKRKGDSPVPPNFLVGLVDDIMNPKVVTPPARCAAEPGGWKSTATGIETMGKKVGLPQNVGELHRDYAVRIEVALSQRQGTAG